MSLVVIVDDRVTNRNIFSKLAASIDTDVIVRAFADPADALAWLADNSPDLIITDFKMPGMDGAEFIRRYRASPTVADVPIIVITVYEERSFRLRGLEAGATDFLNSPVDHYEFVTRARNLLKLHHHQKLLASRAISLERELESSERSRVLALRDSSERLAQVIDTLPIMISAADRDGCIMFVNSFQAAVLGVDLSAMADAPAATLLGKETAARHLALNKIVLEQGAPLQPYEEEMCDRSGGKRTFLTTKSPLRDASNAITGVLTSSLDITTRKAAEAHLRHLAHHDTLTGLPNRSLLVERLTRQIARARRGDQLFALHTIDIDGFKRINDLLGHSAGDRYLTLIGEHVGGLLREGDTLARVSGDEFAVIQTGVHEASDAVAMAQRILAAIANTSDFEGAPFDAGASIGIAMHPNDGANPEELIKNAGLAMQRVKTESGNSYCFYAADMLARARQQAALDAELRRALENDEFQLFYQPQIDLSDDHVIGAEALLRWRRPGVGIVSPGLFLSRAEENGLIVPINEWVLREACREARLWQSPGQPTRRVSVNLSPVQFRKRTVPLLVATTLADTGLDPAALDLELTEGIVMEDLEAVADDLRQLLALGVNVSIDDFGTGYSSLNYIKRLPLNRLKIDQSFVRGLNSDPNDAAIVRAIVTLGHSLDLVVLAEGVETQAQLTRLRAEGCDEAQGYLIGKPMPAADFRAMLTLADGLAKSA